MAEVSFGAGAVPVAEVVPPETASNAAKPTQPAPAANTTTAVATAGPVLGDFLPTFKDIILPHITLAQNMGDLGKTYPPGTLVFDNRLPIFMPPDIDKTTGAVKRPASAPVIITVLGWKDIRYVEKCEGGARGMIVNSEAAVVQAGGTQDWQEWQLKKGAGMKYFQALATAFAVIQRPESCPDDDTVFTWLVDGAKYALAWWNMKGAVYTEAARKVFFTHRQTGCLKKAGYPSWSYAVTTKLQSYPGGKSAWVPVCIPNKPSTESFLDFARTTLQPAPQPAS